MEAKAKRRFSRYCLSRLVSLPESKVVAGWLLVVLGELQDEPVGCCLNHHQRQVRRCHSAVNGLPWKVPLNRLCLRLKKYRKNWIFKMICRRNISSCAFGSDHASYLPIFVCANIKRTFTLMTKLPRKGNVWYNYFYFNIFFCKKR